MYQLVPSHLTRQSLIALLAPVPEGVNYEEIDAKDPEELTEVVIKVESITLERSSGDVVIDTFTIDELDVVDADTWREIADRNVFDFGFDVLPHYIGQMRGFSHEGYHRDIGNHEALDAANADAKRLFQ